MERAPLRKKIIYIFVLIFFCAGGRVFAETARVEPCPDSKYGQRVYDAATWAAEKEIIETAQANENAKNALQKVTDCISKYKDINLGGMFSLPDLSGIIRGALDELAQMVCNEVDATYSSIASKFDKSVVLPGGISMKSTSNSSPTNRKLDNKPVKVTLERNSTLEDMARKGAKDMAKGVLR